MSLKRSWKKNEKFGNDPVVYDGVRYDSKLEARYAAKLDIAKKSKALDFWLRQVPFRLPGGKTYRLDFMEFWQNGDVVFTECKGHWTDMAKLKVSQVEELYGIQINVVTR